MSERSLFLAALDIDNPSERSAYLEQACAGDPVLRAQIEQLLKAHQQSGLFMERPAPALCATVDDPIRERPGTVIGPYKLMEQIGEGGMGLVFVAEQLQPVRRKVALKVIKPGMDTRQVVARFEAERQALAIMDHPNIAKVLDGGETAGGRPYFVMELVKGLPITEYCDQNQVPIRQRLELFVSVCEAVQHAHQKGIIHRDLKPSNVMVVSHDGRPVVKVIDFGVAKAIGQQLTEKTIYTQFSQMVGTPLYMSPEQAGQSGLDVDTRSDIYSLGVLLYELLTGTTPFDRERMRELSYDEMRRIIREEEPPKPSTRISTLGKAATAVSMQRQSEPRQLSRLFRGELDWIVMKALEKDRNRRYETTNGLARDIQRYLMHEPVEACPPSVGYRLRKLVRRHRLALAVSGLILLFILSLGTVVGWTVRDREERKAKAAKDMEMALDLADSFQDSGKRAEALAALERAELLADVLPSDSPLKERLSALKRDWQFIARFEEVRLHEQSGVDVKKSRFTSEAAFPTIRNALHQYGIVLGDTPPAQASACLQGRPESIRRNILAALDECLKLAPKDDSQTRQWLLTTLEAADNDAWRVQVRKAMAGNDWKTLDPLVRKADVPRQSPSFLLSAAKAFPESMKAIQLELLRRVQSVYLADLWANHELATALSNNGRPAEAIRYFTAALALRPDNPGIFVNRGLALRDAGELDAAIADFRQSIHLAPQYGRAHFNLGEVLRTKGQLEEAISEFRTSIELDPKDLWGHIALGNALSDKGRLDEAIAEHRKAIELDPESAVAHHNLGNGLDAKGKLDEAIAEYRKAIDLDPKFAAPHVNLGNDFRVRGRLEEAIAEYRTAIDLDPRDAVPYNCLGAALYEQKKLDEAVTEIQKAIELDPKLAAPHSNLGNVLDAKGKLDEAITEYRKAIELDPKSAMPHNNLGHALRTKGQLEEAIAEGRKAIELDPKLPLAHYNLGVALFHQKKLDEAITEHRKAIELDPKYADAYIGLGCVMHVQGRLDEAISEYRKAIELDPESALYHSNLGNALRDKDRWDEAIAQYRQVLRIKKDDYGAHGNLGSILRYKGRLDEAIAEFREAIRIKKDGLEPHYNLALTLTDKGRLKEAIGEYREALRINKDFAPASEKLRQTEQMARLDDRLPRILEGKEQPKDAAECLGYALLCQQQFKKQYAAATRFFSRAFAEEPKLADDLDAGHRYSAACAAALGGSGQSVDAEKLDAKERARLRRQALDWLRADLKAYRQVLERSAGKAGPRIVQRVQWWLQDDDLGGVRGAESLAKLPEAEHKEWEKFWQEVETLRQQAAQPPKTKRSSRP